MKESNYQSALNSLVSRIVEVADRRKKALQLFRDLPADEKPATVGSPVLVLYEAGPKQRAAQEARQALSELEQLSKALAELSRAAMFDDELGVVAR